MMQPGCWDFELCKSQPAAVSQRMLVCGPAEKLGLTAWPVAAAPCMPATSAQNALHNRSGMQFNAPKPLFTLASAASGPPAAPAAAAAHTRASDSSSDDDLDTTVMRMLSRLAKYAALATQMVKFTRQHVGVVPTLLVGDVFLVGSESCGEASAAAEAGWEGTLQPSMLFQRKRAMHTSSAAAKAAAGAVEAQLNSSRGQPGADTRPRWPGLCSMSLGMAAMVMRRVPGYAFLPPDPRQVEEAKKLRRGAKAAADARSDDTSEHLPVFTVPGVHLMLPSRRGDVCFTPLFLNRQQLDSTAAGLQELIARHRRVMRRIDRRMHRMAVESVAAEFMGLPGPSSPGWQHGQGADEAPQGPERESGSGGSSGGIQPVGPGPGGLTAAISRAVVGALSAALRAREAGANAVDCVSSHLDLDGSPSLHPWTQDDVDSMRAGLTTTAGMAFRACVELQQQGNKAAHNINQLHLSQDGRLQGTALPADSFGANVALTMGLPNIGRLQIEQDRAFGRGSVKDEGAIEHMGPNRGVILIGDCSKEAEDIESGDKPHYVQLPDGRKIRGLDMTLTDGNVLATCR